MQLQSGMSNCGASALSNALQALGWSGCGQEAIADLAGTSADGTNAGGLKRAARKLGASVGIVSTRVAQDAWALLRAALLDGHAAVLSVDRDEHWLSAVGLLGHRVLLVDPAMVVRPMLSACAREDLLRGWKGRRGSFYGIVVGRRV